MTARYRMADLSVRAKGLLTDCCTASDLGALVLHLGALDWVPINRKG